MSDNRHSVKHGSVEKGPRAGTRIGDCLAPGTIAAAVFSGHAFAREIDAPDPGDVPFRRERATV